MPAVALVTGASSGIGRELARLLAADGHELVLLARDEARLHELAEEVRSAHGVAAHPLPLDLSEDGAAARVGAWLAERRLNVDVLVNAAGVAAHGPFRSSEAAAEHAVLMVNCVALTELTKLVVPGMVERRVGRVLNVAAAEAGTPQPLAAVYGASKAYVRAFGEALADEISVIGLTVTTLCPPRTATPFEERSGRRPSRLDPAPLDAETVAREGYRALLDGRRVVVPGQREPLVRGTIASLRRRRMAELRRRVRAERG
jgi:short-subunit dehydrogenase